MLKIPRYTVYGRTEAVFAELAEGGPWCKWEDVQAAIRSLGQTALEQILKADTPELRAAYQNGNIPDGFVWHTNDEEGDVNDLKA